MPADTLGQLAGAVSGPVMMRHLRELARWTKLAGTAEERKSLDYIRGVLDGYGLRTTVLEHDAYISLPGKARVEVDAAVLRAITFSHARPSPPEGTCGRLIDVGVGRAADFEGRDVRGCIALASGIASHDVTRWASQAGAAGLLFASPHEHLHEACVSSVWGNPSRATLEQMPTVVSCTITAEDAAVLRARLTTGETPHVVLHAEVDTGWRKTPILIADLLHAGGHAEEPFVLFSGHHDTWYHGVMDNGAANIAMLEVARHCATRPAEMRRNLRLCFWSGHSQGRFSGSAWYADEHWDELERLCVAHVNIDSPGGVGATVLQRAGAAAELMPLAADAVGMQAGQAYIGKRKTHSQDESFSGIGVPAMFGVLSEQPPGQMRVPLGWWWHTPDDLMEHIDEAFLVRDTRVLMHAVWRLLSDPILPLDYEAQAKALLEELEKLSVALAGRLAIDGLVAAARRLGEAARTAVCRASPERVNRALMRASRALVPIDYTHGDRFTHDPAMPQPAWPSLQPLRLLAAAPANSDIARFCAVDAVGARNRVAFALREAITALETP